VRPLRDREPADYARAVRIFPESKQAIVRFKVLAKQASSAESVGELWFG
jgi:hypothetical protein